MTFCWRGNFRMSTFVEVMRWSFSCIHCLIFLVVSSSSNVSQMVATLSAAFAHIASLPLILVAASNTIVFLSASTSGIVLGICQACRSSTWHWRSWAIFVSPATLAKESSSTYPFFRGNATMTFLMESTNVTWLCSRDNISYSFSARILVFSCNSRSFPCKRALRSLAFLWCFSSWVATTFSLSQISVVTSYWML